MANALGGLGNVYRAQSRYEVAMKALTEAHEIHGHLNNELGVGSALVDLGGDIQCPVNN